MCLQVSAYRRPEGLQPGVHQAGIWRQQRSHCWQQSCSSAVVVRHRVLPAYGRVHEAMDARLEGACAACLTDRFWLISLCPIHHSHTCTGLQQYLSGFDIQDPCNLLHKQIAYIRNILHCLHISNAITNWTCSAEYPCCAHWRCTVTLAKGFVGMFSRNYCHFLAQLLLFAEWPVCLISVLEGIRMAPMTIFRQIVLCVHSCLFMHNPSLVCWSADSHHQAHLVQPPQHLQGCRRGQEGVQLLQALHQGPRLWRTRFRPQGISFPHYCTGCCPQACWDSYEKSLEDQAFYHDANGRQSLSMSKSFAKNLDCLRHFSDASSVLMALLSSGLFQ